MKLIRLLPDQVMDRWNFIKDCIRRGLPPAVRDDELVLVEIQSKLLVDELICWFAMESLESDIVYGVMTTGIITDPFSNTKNLLIYTIATTNAHPDNIWWDSYIPLRRYALGQGCKAILAYTNDPRVIEIAKNLGGNVDWNLIQLSV